MTRHLLGITALLASACAYDAPLDTAAPAVLNTITGTIVLGAPVAPDDVLVLLYAADDPPPPAGLGRPVNISTVPAQSFTGDGAGLQSAPYTLTRVPDGNWLITAVMDVDDDFLPLLTATAGPTCGDWGGAHVDDLSTLALAPITVDGGESKDEVTVLLGRQYTTERPAFRFGDDNEVLLDFETPADLGFGIRSTGVSTELIELGGPEEATGECITGFVVLVEPTEDGGPAPHWEYGAALLDEDPSNDGLAAYAFSIWPRVFVSYTGSGDAPLAAGESWTIEAIHDPTGLQTGTWPIGTAFPLSELGLLLPPVALHVRPDGSEELVQDPAQIPRGEWAVTVVSFTGQSWTVPNELAGYPATDESFEPSTQGARLRLE